MNRPVESGRKEKIGWLILLGENKYIEYKAVYTKTLLKTVSAFANYHDGVIIIGIDDNKFRKIGL
ncbi:MAG: helix-turn-helix domain-containing protein [Eubacteriaceae bacterium]